MHSSELSFVSTALGGPTFNPTLSIQDRFQSGPYPYPYNMPPVIVEENRTTEQNLDYKTGMIKVRMRVADGRPFSSPSVSGNYLTNDSGLRDKYVYLLGSANSVNVVEGMVHLYAVPGTYQLTAQGNVSGSTTTFGPPFFRRVLFRSDKRAASIRKV